MNCKKAEEHIDAYIDGELKDELQALEDHIETCESCKRYYQETLDLKKMLNDLEAIDLPDDFQETLHEKLLESKVVPFYRKPSMKKLGFVSSIAAVALIAFMSGLTVEDALDKDKDFFMENKSDYSMEMASSEDEDAEMSFMEADDDDQSMRYGNLKTVVTMGVAPEEGASDLLDEAAELADEAADPADEANGIAEVADDMPLASMDKNVTLGDPLAKDDQEVSVMFSEKVLAERLSINHYQIAGRGHSDMILALLDAFDYAHLQIEGETILSFDLPVNQVGDFVDGLGSKVSILQALNVKVINHETESHIKIIIEMKEE